MVWEEIISTPAPLHPLERQTELYGDVFIAVRIFGMRYPEYMAQTTRHERYLYRLFLVLEAKKEEFAREQMEAEMEQERHNARLEASLDRQSFH
jgi:hypothetical protein